MPLVASYGESIEGADKIFSFESVVAEFVNIAISGADGYLDSDAVPAGKIWVITNVLAYDSTSPITGLFLALRHNGVEALFFAKHAAIGAAEYVSWGGHIYLDAEDVIRAYFDGALADDAVRIRITGYQMNAP